MLSNLKFIMLYAVKRIIQCESCFAYVLYFPIQIVWKEDANT